MAAHFAELPFRVLQVLLNFFELRKRFEALRGLLIQVLKFDLELLGSE